MTDRVKDAVHRWLDVAGTAMGGNARGRRDALLELENAIYDRVEERTASGQVADEAVREVLDSMGDPIEVGSSYAPVRPLIPPHQTRPFLLNLVVLFAVHFLLVIGATVAGHGFSVPPFQIEPIANPKHILDLLARAAQTLLFDAGLLLCVFALVPRLGPMLSVRSVRPNARRCIEGAFFMALVLVVLNFLRDNLLALYVTNNGETTQVPIVGPGIVDNLLWLNLWLGLAIVRDVLYARRGESKLTVAMDVTAIFAGMFCLLRIMASPRLVDLSAAQAALGPAADTLGAVLNTTFNLLALITAAILAAQLSRRAFRLSQLKD